ncbi:MAG: DUF1643 domain-containing protein [Telluria sp.]
MNKSTMTRGAALSSCRTYRYHLWREWDASQPRMLLIMLNPSTAHHERDDHTITKSIAIARHLGCGRLDVGNLAAFRSPHPADLKAAEDPIGPHNDRHLRRMLRAADLVVCAWGANAAALPGRAEAVGKLIRKAGHLPFALKLTGEGYPSHPLARGKAFIPVAVDLVPYLS